MAAFWAARENLLLGGLFVSLGIDFKPVTAALDWFFLKLALILPWSLDDILPNDVPSSPPDEPEATPAAFASLEVDSWELVAVVLLFAVFAVGVYWLRDAFRSIARDLGARHVVISGALVTESWFDRTSIPLAQVANVKVKRTWFGTDLVIKVRGRKHPIALHGVRNADMAAKLVSGGKP